MLLYLVVFSRMTTKEFDFKKTLTPLIDLIVNIHLSFANRLFTDLTSQSLV